MKKMYRIDGASIVPVERGAAQIVVYSEPTDEERATLRSTYGLDEHTLSSLLDPDEIPRIEISPAFTVLIWKRPTNYTSGDKMLFGVNSIGLLLLDAELLIITPDSYELPFSSVRTSFTSEVLMGVALELQLHTIQHFRAHLKLIKMIAGEMQEKVNLSIDNNHLLQMFGLSESLVYYINAIDSNGAVLARLRNHTRTATPSPEIVAFIDDLIIDNTQCSRQAEIYSTVMSGLMDARGTIVNNNMNVLLKNLTIISVVFLPLNLIASIGGMSEYSVMTQGIDWRISYSAFSISMIVIGWISMWVLKRNFRMPRQSTPKSHRSRR